MKKLALLIFVFTAMSLTGCINFQQIMIGRYHIQKVKTAGPLTGYNKVFIGWVDLNEDDYKFHGFGSKEQWAKVINYANVSWFQVDMKNLMTAKGKTVVFADSSEAVPPQNVDLAVKFDFIKYIKKYTPPPYNPFDTTPFRVSDRVQLQITITDVKAKKIVYQAKVRLIEQGPRWGTGYESHKFENRVNFLLSALSSFMDSLMNDSIQKDAYTWDVNMPGYTKPGGYPGWDD